uniref:ADAM metallopeptidase with thrombospondin type 1 motif 7 n=1 Tax=Ornithorhynchus anatinus TaxID=9258 RepID=A0A6I8P898_ORNAN
QVRTPALLLLSCLPRQMPPGFDIVHPVQVDAGGSFVSYDLSPRVLHKRDLSSRTSSPSYYELHYRGQDLRFNLSVNQGLLAPGFVRERRHGGLARTRIQASPRGACHLLGEVRTQQRRGGLAAISTCSGLKGVFRLSHEDYFIEPLDVREPEAGTAHPHVIYKRQAPEHQEDSRANSSVGRETKPPGSEKRRERWEQKQQRKRRIRQRSISKEKWVETLVVADQKMVEYHRPEHIENYVLTVMNMVAGLFQDSSIGNPINIALVRLVLLEDDEVDLKISHHADNTLKSFCKWQKNINTKSDAHPQHHDVAVLLTRKDICAAMNKPCETLGLSHVSGMCQPHRSCNINEDTGLPLAFTVAHELGHSFGIQHDGSGNDCEPVGKRPFIMSPQLLYDTSPLTWSRCSREYVTRFLDRGWGLCLDDPPAKNVIDFPSVPPGVLYDVSHQCRLQYGAYSTFCDDMDNVCNTLWCSVGTTCHSKLDAAVDGTTCGESKWCFNGDCVHKGFRPEAIHGGWGAWSSWSVCSRSCGAVCAPGTRGKYCVGERKRFRVCNVKACPSDRLSFRHIQCSQFNAMLYKGKLYKWVPVPNNVNPCELHCRPEGEYFAEKLRDAVVDGTPCYEGNTSRDVCINGICKNVGCDYEIDSNAIEDRCGVCHGDGSTCQTVKKTFEESEGLGYVDVGLIPAGAREIRIEEVAEAGNFLALRSEDPEKYFLNGGWTIQWNGDYKVAGTTFTYERTGNWENLTSPGPTREPVWIQLLFQESNPGVRYEYTIRRGADSENEIQPPEFSWHYGSWTKCTATCGTGVQRQSVHCVEKLAGLVEEHYCDALSRPDDRQKKCSEEPCPARWWVAEWQKCSVTCGDAGLRKRTVLCIQSVGLDEQRALPPGDCLHLPKPDAREPCPGNPPCPARWATGNWSEAHPDWSGSGSSSKELFNEIHYIPGNHFPKFPPLGPGGAPGANDLNLIDEDDFASPGGKKGNVFVDDFYYDYNFINFHEDLSYSPPGERDEGSEGRGDDDGRERPGAGEATPTTTPLEVPPQTATEGGDEPKGGKGGPPRATDQGEGAASGLHPSIGDSQEEEEEEEAETPPRLGETANASGDKDPTGPEPEGQKPPAGPRDHGSATLLPPRLQGDPPEDLAPLLPTPALEEPSPEGIAQDPGDAVRFLDPGRQAPAGSSASPGGTQDPGHSSPATAETVPGADGPEWSPPSCLSGPAGPKLLLMSPSGLQCSTTCGLGGIWRTVRCSSGREEDCVLANKPVPARRCYLRPCASWSTGNWSKCSKNCGGGSKVRDVHCADLRDQRPLRPFHCQPLLGKPPAQLPCHVDPCLDWYMSSWRECSEACGGGEQQRLVTCPQFGKCDELLRPNTTRPCNTHPCTKWVVGSWGPCTAPCGGGIQRRLVKCVNTKTGHPEEDSSLCDHEAWPENSQKCNPQDCDLGEFGSVCDRDHLTFSFCETLRLLGRCLLPTVRVQCCRTCSLHGSGPRERGDERASRR